MTPHSVGFAIACLLLPTAVFAQQKTPTGEPTRLDTVAVIARQADRAATVTVISGAIMQQQHVSVAYDAFRMQPGLHLVSRLGLTGTGLSRLTIRGAGAAGPAGLQIFVDGRPDATVTFAHPIPQAHSLENVERIEVTHGPSPVLDGSGNTGVVNIRSVEPGPGWSRFLQLSGGSWGTSENFARVGYGGERAFIDVSGTYRRTDGYLPRTDAWVAGGKVRAGYRFDDDWRLTFSAANSQDHFSVFGPFSVPGPFGNPGTTDLDLTQTAGDLALEGRLGAVSTRLQLWGDVLDPRSQVVPAGAKRADVREIGARWRSSLSPWTGGEVIAGVDVLRATARNTPALPPAGPDIDVRITEVGPYLFAEQKISPQLTLNGGVRFTQHSEYGSEPSGEAGLILRPGGRNAGSRFHGTALRARAVRGFQSPTLQQLFGVFGGGLAGPANPDLQPERLDQIETGVNQRYRRWGFDVAAFLQRGDNQITSPPGELRNTGEFHRSGVEAQLDVLPWTDLRLRLGVTSLDLSDNVLRVPKNTVDFGVTYTPGALRQRDFSVNIDARYANDTFDQALAPNSPRLRLEDYLVAYVKAELRLREGIRGFVALDNVTDEKYRTVLNVPAPGLGVFAGISAQF